MLSSSAALHIPVAPSVLFLWCQRSCVIRRSSDISQRPHNPNELFIQPLLPINTTVLTEPYQYSGISSPNTHKKVSLQMCSSFSHPEWKQKQPSQDSFTPADTTYFSPPFSNKIWKCWPQSSFQSLLFFTETMLVGLSLTPLLHWNCSHQDQKQSSDCQSGVTVMITQLTTASSLNHILPSPSRTPYSLGFIFNFFGSP